MVNTLFPTGSAAAPATFSGRQLRQSLAPFLSGATPARPLGARSGVRPGTSPTTVTATSTTWSCAPHAGTLDVQVAAEAGPYEYAIDASVGGAVTAADASNPRQDIVYVQLNDPIEQADGSTPGVVPRYLAGAPRATPADGAPSLPARSIILARINVPRSGGGAPTVTWVAPYMAAAGGVVDYASKAMLLADAPTVGTVGRDIETGSMYVRHPGTTPFWLHLGGRPDTTTQFTGGQYWRSSTTRPILASAVGGRIFLEGAVSSDNVTYASGTEYATGTIPAAFAPKVVKTAIVDVNRVPMTLVLYPDGTISFRAGVTFQGVLELSLDGVSYADKRL